METVARSLYRAVLPASAVLTVACIGLIHVPYPFGGDQALFALGARAMHDGAVLYRDFWDLKQPAIFLFYFTGGTLFGFSEVGIHLFELLYFVAFAFVLQATLRGAFRFPASSASAALFVVGFYYVNATPFSLTQVEALAGVPLYLSVYFLLVGTTTHRTRYFVASGLMGAIALSFKLLFLPLIILIWLVLIFAAAQKQPPNQRNEFYKETLAAALSLVAATLAWMTVTIAVAGKSAVLSTFFTYPLEISRTIPPAPIDRLIHSLASYAVGVLPLVVLSFVAVFRNRALLRNPLWLACAAWIAGACLVIFMQRQSWWQYQMELFGVPLGILAAFGVDALCAWTREGRRSGRIIPLIAVLVLSAAPIKHLSVTLKDLLHSGLARDAADRIRFQALVDPADRAVAETRFLHFPGALPGDIYVCGDPRYYLAASRRQAGSINGWALELLMPAQWKELRTQIEDTRPAYIFVSTFYRKLLPQRSPDFSRHVLEHYRLVHRDPAGDWYRLKDSPERPAPG